MDSMTDMVRIHADEEIGQHIEIDSIATEEEKQPSTVQAAVFNNDHNNNSSGNNHTATVREEEDEEEQQEQKTLHNKDGHNTVIYVQTFRDLVYGIVMVTLLNGWLEGVFLAFAISGNGDFADIFQTLHLLLGLVGGLYLYPVTTLAPWCCFSRGPNLQCCCGDSCYAQGCCGGCCGLFRTIGRGLLTTATPLLLPMLPALLLLAGLLPVTAPHMYLNNFAVVVMFALAWRTSTHQKLLAAQQSGILQASLLLSFAARAVFRSDNNFYWEMKHSWLLCLPLLISQLWLNRRRKQLTEKKSNSSSSNSDNNNSELVVITPTVKNVADESKQGVVVDYELAQVPPQPLQTHPHNDADNDSAVDDTAEFAEWEKLPSAAEEETLTRADYANGAFVSFAFFSTISIATSPALIVRGSGLVPDGINYTVPFLLWAVCLLIAGTSTFITKIVQQIGTVRLHRDVFSLLQLSCIVLFLFLPEGIAPFVFGIACLPLASWTMHLAVKRLLQGGRHRRVLRGMAPFLGPYVGVMIVQWFSMNANLGSYRLHLCTTWLCLLISNAVCFYVTPALPGSDTIMVSVSHKQDNIQAQRKVTWVLLLFLAVAAGLTNTVTPSAAPENDGTIVFSAWNVQRLYPYAGTGNAGYRLADYMNNHDMGIVGFQESETIFPLVGSKDSPHLLAAATLMHHFYGVNPLRASFNGCSLLSRYKLANCEGIDFAQSSIFPTFTGALCEVLGLEHPLYVMSAHATLTPPTDARKSIDIMMDRALILLAQGYEVVIVGDMNLSPDHPDMQPFFSNGFKSATQEFYVPEGVERTEANNIEYIPPSRPSSGSIVDYVLYSSGLELVTAEVVLDTQPLADHVLVQATLQWVI